MWQFVTKSKLSPLPTGQVFTVAWGSTACPAN